jgi:hypothetical protein
VTARISSPSLGGAPYSESGTWSLGIAHRWQYSDKHFVDDQQQHYRESEGSEVINDVHIIDLGASYQITKRFGLTLSVPYSKATRSQALRDPRRARNPDGTFQTYRDNRGVLRTNVAFPSGFPSPEGVINGRVVQRFQTEANGLGDIKLMATGWILNPEKYEKGNVSGGIGVLFPTGESEVKDTFKTITRTPNDASYTIGQEVQNVDNSIQPGAGAWGIIFDIYSFYQMKENITLFASGTYISTPQADAGVISGSLTAASPTVWSTGDAYLARVGGGWTFLPEQGLTFTLAARAEGSPSKDLIGEDTGRRRPGYAISVEPGLVWAKSGWVVAFSTPVAIYRNRTTSFGTADPGDAAFADFFTLLSVNKRF